MSFLIETAVCAVAAYLATVLFSHLRKKETPSYEKFPWSRWCFALLVGGAGGGLISGALQGVVFGEIGNWAAFGTVISFMQWLVLSRFIPTGMYWALAGTIGWSFLALFQFLALPTPLDWFLTGILVGILQWLLIRNKVSNSYWWILVNGIAWSLGGFFGIFGGLVFLSFTGNPVLTWVVGWAAIGLIGAVILGIPLKNMTPLTAEPKEA